MEEMRRRNVANLPPPTTDGKAARGGTMLDHLQVILTPIGEHQELQELMSELFFSSATIFRSYKSRLNYNIQKH